MATQGQKTWTWAPWSASNAAKPPAPVNEIPHRQAISKAMERSADASIPLWRRPLKTGGTLETVGAAFGAFQDPLYRQHAAGEAASAELGQREALASALGSLDPQTAAVAQGLVDAGKGNQAAAILANDQSARLAHKRSSKEADRVRKLEHENRRELQKERLKAQLKAAGIRAAAKGKKGWLPKDHPDYDPTNPAHNPTDMDLDGIFKEREYKKFQNFDTIMMSNKSFDPKFSGFSGIKGFEDISMDLAERGGALKPLAQMLSRFASGGRRPEDLAAAAQWWATERMFNQMVLRKELFGATLTNNEKADWERAAIHPAMSGEKIAKRLAIREAIILRHAHKQAKLGVAGTGYKKPMFVDFYMQKFNTGFDMTDPDAVNERLQQLVPGLTVKNNDASGAAIRDFLKGDEKPAMLNKVPGVNVQGRGGRGDIGAAPPPPKIDDVIDGYRFKGGNPNDPNSYEKVK